MSFRADDQGERLFGLYAPSTERRIAIWMRHRIRQYRTDLDAFVDGLHYSCGAVDVSADIGE